MNQANKNIGFELVCRATDCAYNDHPACIAHSERSPVIIGLQGRCIRYKKADVSGGSED